MANFVVIMADDMRYDELQFMPNTRRLLAGRGTTFTSCRVNVPLCSPARGGFLTGQYSKVSGIITNGTGPDTTEYNNSMAKAMDNAGYRVGCVGKFFTELASLAVKPGFDFWRCIVGDGGSGYDMYEEMTYEIYDGSSTIQPNEYQAHYLTGQVIDFIRGSEPFFMWYNPTQPHWPWDTGPPNHLTDYEHRMFDTTIESSVTDKPSWIQALPTLTQTVIDECRIEERQRIREVRSLDDSVGAIITVLEATGKMDNTYIFFTSDNGNMYGEHRIVGPGAGAYLGTKNHLYEPALRVPLVMCTPPALGKVPKFCSVPVNHQDITSTILSQGSATALLGSQVGGNLLDIAVDPGSYSTRKLLHYRDTAGDGSGFPTADGITTSQYKLIRYQGQSDPNKYELYDMTNDPDEFTNQAYSGGAWLTLRNSLESDLNALLA